MIGSGILRRFCSFSGAGTCRVFWPSIPPGTTKDRNNLPVSLGQDRQLGLSREIR